MPIPPQFREDSCGICPAYDFRRRLFFGPLFSERWSSLSACREYFGRVSFREVGFLKRFMIAGYPTACSFGAPPPPRLLSFAACPGEPGNLSLDALRSPSGDTLSLAKTDTELVDTSILLMDGFMCAFPTGLRVHDFWNGAPFLHSGRLSPARFFQSSQSRK